MIILLSIVFSVNLLLANGNSTTERYVGTAVDLKSGKFIYTEEHEASYAGNELVSLSITYRNEKNTLIAKKTVQFNGTSSIASFRMENFVHGTVEGAEQSAVGIRLFERENARAPFEEKIISIPDPGAVDAGLNNLVRNHWEQLQRSESIDFYLGVPSQLDYFHFRVVKHGEELFNGRKSLVVRFESDYWFIRLFVDPVRVWYDGETRRAVMYEGISNIYNDEGKSYVVRVTFDKPGP